VVLGGRGRRGPGALIRAGDRRGGLGESQRAVGDRVRHLVQCQFVEVADGAVHHQRALVGGVQGRVSLGVSAVGDRVEAVARLVVAGVVGDAGDASVYVRLLGGLGILRAGEQAACRIPTLIKAS
jgi:hypothetical protein